MTAELIADLQRNTLIGYTDLRGPAWHSADLTDNPNAFREEVPVERVLDLIGFEIVKRPLYFRGVTKSNVRAPGQYAWVRKEQADTPEGVLGYTGSRYREHPYTEWCWDLASQIVGPDSKIGQAGLLKNGARAWVSIELPRNRMAAGMEWRPQLLATSVYDRSMSTTFKLVQTRVVCDNTREAALSESGSSIKVRHTSGGLLDAASAQEALGLLVDDASDPFMREAELLLGTAVSDAQYDRFVKELTGDNERSAHARTIVGKHRSAMLDLWMTDERVKPWRGTAFGALQAANTWQQWMRLAKGAASRPERNMSEVVGARMLQSDRDAMHVMVKAGIRMPADFGLDTPRVIKRRSSTAAVTVS